MSSNDDGSGAPKPENTESIEATESSGPIEPTESTGPIEPTESIEPTVPTEPTEIKKPEPDAEEPAESSTQVNPEKDVTVETEPQPVVKDSIPIPQKEPELSGSCPDGNLLTMSSNNDGSEAAKPKNTEASKPTQPSEAIEPTEASKPTVPAEPTEFKKPVLIGRMGKLPKKVEPEAETPVESSSQINPDTLTVNRVPLPAPRDYIPIPYKEPAWSGLCPEGSEYGLEVLKSGVIVNKMDLTFKPYYVFGRFTNCDVIVTHPTISRHHAVLQYKAFAEEGEPSSGWYLYDLGSTHGTFLNKEQIKQKHYVRIKVGHQFKFGTSARSYIVLGPDFDVEGESELSVTEIKKRAQEMKIKRDKMIQEARAQREKDRLEEEKRRLEQGIDWGMGEDAEDEPDLTENPYASTLNEELYLNDPKKTLRGYFEREGHELSYSCEERGVGQYICKVELPMNDVRGKPLSVEIIHNGKKKEAVAACALEACRVLDRAGLLRQARHESRRRKQRDWGADDYYDSDEDTFLDRTGNVERKRLARMAKYGVVQPATQKPMTYDDLIRHVAEIESKLTAKEAKLEQLRAAYKQKKEEGRNKEDDDLDNYMQWLGSQGHGMAEKADISRTKMSILKQKTKLSKYLRLAELARPAHLPPLIKKDDIKMAIKQTNSVVYGKRIKIKEEKKPKVVNKSKQDEGEFVEEMDSDDEAGPSNDKKVDEESKDITEVVPEAGTSKDLKVDGEESKDITELEPEAGPSKDVKVDGEKSKYITEVVPEAGSSKDVKVDREESKDITEVEPEAGTSKDVKVDGEKSKDITDVESEAGPSKDVKVDGEESKDITEVATVKVEEAEKDKKIYGPMRPPDNYKVPEGYFDQETDRDLPEIAEKE